MAQSAFISKLCGGRAWGQMVFPSKHCGGALHTVQPRGQTAAVMEKQATSPSTFVRPDRRKKRRGELSPMTRSLEPHTNTLMRVDGTNTLGSVNVRPTLPSSAASCPYCGGSGFALMAVQAGPQHSSVLGRESQHVFMKVFCIKVKVIFNFGKMSWCLEGKEPA